MLIDKDLRLSISGCFWLFYASKYKQKKILKKDVRYEYFRFSKKLDEG